MPLKRIKNLNNNSNRSDDPNDFSTLTALLDSKISFHAKGIYIILHNASDDAPLNTYILSTVSSDSEDLIAEGIKELEENKYLKIEGDTYIIFEVPYEHKCLENSYDIKDNKSSKDLPNHNLTKKALSQNFKSYNIDLFSEDDVEKFGNDYINARDNMSRNLADADDFIFNIENESTPNLLFYGNTGTGKTYLANYICNYLIEQGYTVRSYSIIELLDFINEALIIDRQGNLAEYKMLTECDLLVIDDLGTESITSFTNNRLFNILNARMQNYKKTILCTNLSIPDISKLYSQNIFSRIIESYKINKFIGGDLRWRIK